MATGTTEYIDNTTADVFIPEIWSNTVLVARESRLVFGDLVDRSYEKDLKFGDTVHVGSIGNLAARAKTLNSNSAITYETITETNTNLTVNTWEYAAIAVEDIIKIQANRNLMTDYGGKMGYALGLSVDDNLAGLPDNSTTNVLGVFPAEFDYEDFLRAIQYLDDLDIPAEERYFVFSPAASMGSLKLDKFIHNDYSTLHGGVARLTAKEKGYITSFLGIPIYKSTNVEGTNAAGHDNVLMHKDAFALVMQMKPKVGHFDDLDYFVSKVAVQNIYGTAVMRETEAVWMKGP